MTRAREKGPLRALGAYVFRVHGRRPSKQVLSTWGRSAAIPKFARRTVEHYVQDVAAPMAAEEYRLLREFAHIVVTKAPGAKENLPALRLGAEDLKVLIEVIQRVMEGTL